MQYRAPRRARTETRQAGELLQCLPKASAHAVARDVCDLFAGLRATYESLARTDALERFDLFVLSASNDPDTLVAERQAWLDLCTAVGGLGRVFYRWRRHRVKRKSGNIADFCRR